MFRHAPLRGLAAMLLTTTVLVAGSATATTLFTGVAAGDASETRAILWTRTTDASGNGVADASLAVQVSTDADFRTFITFAAGSSAATGYTTRVDATGLPSGRHQFYRFVAGDGSVSQTGTFKTAPSATTAARVRIGFSGDADGQWRPYTSLAKVGTKNLDAFVLLGDTMYETPFTGTPACKTGYVCTDQTGPLAPDDTVAAARMLDQYRAKYTENLQPAPSGAPSGVKTLLAELGTYTLLDNHEQGNQRYQGGGAPLNTAANGQANAATGLTNTTGRFLNKTPVFQALQRAYLENHPVRASLADLQTTPGDARTDATPKLYFSQRWGSNAELFNVDDRTYRDIRPTNAQVAARAGADVNRTMLGATQLQWLKDGLLAAQKDGTPWKIVAISSPIDITGTDGGKSWSGAYTFERNELLRFIAGNGIDHVVFQSTDDHESRVSQLGYQNVFGDPATFTAVPGAFEIVTGPIGAGNACSGTTPPADCAGTTLANITNLLAASAYTQKPGLQAGAGGSEGVFPGLSGLRDVWRELDPTAGTDPKAVDFYAPNTFAYSILDIDENGTLKVEVNGIPEYGPDSFPTTAPDTRVILSFTIALP